MEGELPRDLQGAYFRNGPNNRFAPPNRYHWFDGDGMIQAVWFDEGRVRYRSRWIDTAAQQARAGTWPGHVAGSARAL